MRAHARPSLRALRLALTLGATASPLGCTDWADTPRATPEGTRIRRIALPGDDLRGLSGLTLAPPGSPFTFLSIAERRHHLIPLRVLDDQILSLPPIPVRGVKADLDLEGLAFLDPDTLIFATEADHARRAEKMLFARWHPDRVEVFGSTEFDYDAWGLVPARNRGLEGICVAGDQVVAASEMVGKHGAHRWSPVGLYRPADETWRPFRVFLSSDTGKLSGLTCRAREGRVEVTAIERHFDLLYLVRLALEGPGGDVQARRIADLRPGFDETPPNFEGLERHGLGAYFLITDNDWRGVRGSTEIIRWEEPAGPVEARAGSPGAQ